VGVAYSGLCSALGGLFGYTYSLVSGSLPPGLILSTSNAISISGTPTTAGTYSFVLKAVDSESPAQSATQSITVTVAPSPPLVVSSCTYPGAQVGVLYSAGSCTATGGALPYTYSLAAGTLPPGLSLFANGNLNGQPTSAGTYPFTVKLTDHSVVPLTATQVISNFVVQPRASETGTVTITATSGGITTNTTITVTVP
jgi:hypothetical protein